MVAQTGLRASHNSAIYNAVYLLGPWLIGCSLELFLQGVLCCQFANYFSWHHEDGRGVRLAVYGLILLTILKSVQSFALIWIQLILHFEDLDGAILLNYTAWWQTGNPLMVATIGLYVQAFFCSRLYTISRKNLWVVVPIVTILVYAYLSIVIATYYISLGHSLSIATWFASHLSSVFAGDLAITLSIAFYLISSKKDVLPQTVGIISALIRLTFQTAAPAALCAMFNLIFSQIYTGDEKLVSTAFNQMLPKLYAFSMMWTLNARRSIRDMRLPVTSDHNSRTVGREAHELSAYNGVQVHTHTETSQQIDVRAMFHRGDQQEDIKPRGDDYKHSTV